MTVSLLVAFCLSFGMCAWVVFHPGKVWLDIPGERSLHAEPVSRLGGVAICIGFAGGVITGWDHINSLLGIPVILAGSLLWLVALLDDRKGCSPLFRLIAQLVAALLSVYAAKQFNPLHFTGWIWPSISIFAIVWGINLYNFMDGMDGLASVMAITGFSAFAVLGLASEQLQFALICGLLVAAILGFLCFNFPPARIFMGDSGSTVLGFAMVVVSFTGWELDIYAAWVPLVIFSPFLADSGFTLIKRIWKHEKVWLPHRQHIYQRWVLKGYSHRRVTFTYFLFMLASVAWVITWQGYDDGYNGSVILGGWVLVCSFAIFFSEKTLNQHDNRIS